MSFKTQIADDIERVFLNSDDFATSHTIEGTTVVCEVDDNAQARVKQGRILGMVEADVIIFGKASDFPYTRGPEELLNVDGKEMIVVKWAEAMGVVEIALEQNRTM